MRAVRAKNSLYEKLTRKTIGRMIVLSAEHCRTGSRKEARQALNELAKLLESLEQKLDKLKGLSSLAPLWDLSALRQADDLLEEALHGFECAESIVPPLTSSSARSQADSGHEDEFLIREGFDLLAAYRAIKDADLRSSILTMIAAIALSGTSQGERWLGTTRI